MRIDKGIFISYAHLDDKPFDDGAKGWITDFHSILETRLQQTIGYEINIWRDQELTGNSVFAAEIESKFPVLKLMVSIITPRYLDSDWCKRELGAFYNSALTNGGVNIGNKSRIFKIIKTPVDKEVVQKLPEDIYRVFDEILDYKFYVQVTDKGENTGKYKELSRSNWVDNTIKQEYMNKLDDVVQDMADLIRFLNKAGEKETEQKKIYLAETTFDLQVYRDNLVRELKEANFIVLPDKNLPLVAHRFMNEVEGYIDQSVLSLHMISPVSYATQPEGADKSIVILQNEIAAKKSETGNLKRLIWIPPSSENAMHNEKMSALQNAFVNELKKNAEIQKGADILEGPLEEFKLAIFDTIKRMIAEEKEKKINDEITAKKTSEGEKAAKRIYLVCDQRDLNNTLDLEDFLTDNGFEILYPLFDGDIAQLRQAHRDYLKKCNAVILYYGMGDDLWINSKKSDLLRLPAYGRSTPLMGQAIYIASPASPEKEKFRSNDVTVINGQTGFDPGQFKDFIQNLK